MVAPSFDQLGHSALQLQNLGLTELCLGRNLSVFLHEEVDFLREEFVHVLGVRELLIG